MKERPILFTAKMVNAILHARKTQTRRVVKPQPPNHIDELHGHGFEDDDGRLYKVPYGLPGDRLWVRETWRVWSWHPGEPMGIQYKDRTVKEVDCEIAYERDLEYDRWHDDVVFQCSRECQKAGMLLNDRGDNYVWWDGEDRDIATSWRPSIHMPRWCSRILLEITSIRVERLQDISEEDVRAEGTPDQFLAGYEDNRLGFRDLWDAINASRGYQWESNPWVWVVGFEKVEEGV